MPLHQPINVPSEDLRNLVKAVIEVASDREPEALQTALKLMPSVGLERQNYWRVRDELGGERCVPFILPTSILVDAETGEPIDRNVKVLAKLPDTFASAVWHEFASAHFSSKEDAQRVASWRLSQLTTK